MGDSHSAVVFQRIFFIVLPVRLFLHPDHDRIIVTYEGISGSIAFDETGDAKRDSAFIKTANTETGVWDFVKVQTVG